MRELIIAGLVAATVVPAAAQAQSRAEVEYDRERVREERREYRDALRYGDPRDIREERDEFLDARRELHEDRRGYRERRAHRRGYTRYVAPYGGFTYRPVHQGYDLRPHFYGQRYHAPGFRSYDTARWIRYGDDLLLVNTRSGRVLQVRRDYFW